MKIEIGPYPWAKSLCGGTWVVHKSTMCWSQSPVAISVQIVVDCIKTWGHYPECWETCWGTWVVMKALILFVIRLQKMKGFFRIVASTRRQFMSPGMVWSSKWGPNPEPNVLWRNMSSWCGRSDGYSKCHAAQKLGLWIITLNVEDHEVIMRRFD